MKSTLKQIILEETLIVLMERAEAKSRADWEVQVKKFLLSWTEGVIDIGKVYLRKV